MSSADFPGRGRGGSSSVRGAYNSFPSASNQHSQSTNSYRGGRGNSSVRGAYNPSMAAEEFKNATAVFVRGGHGNAIKRGAYRHSPSASFEHSQSTSSYSDRGGRGGSGEYNSQPVQVKPSHSTTSSQGTVNGMRKKHQLLPNCQMVRLEDTPIQLHITEEDKAMFGEEITQKLAEAKIDRQLSDIYVPKPRKPVQVFEEDQNFADDYETIVVEDDAIHIEGLGDTTLNQIEKWEDAGFDERLVANIKRAQYTKPRNVQKVAVPLILDGYDLTVRSETGSGKTAAFALPIIDRIIYAKKQEGFEVGNYAPLAVILAPTRELVTQCYEQISKFVDGLDEVTVGETYGEANIGKSKKEIRNADIVVVTPGRFCHFVGKRWLILDRLQFLVFDEGDKFLDDNREKSFKSEIDYVLNNTFIPKDCQILFFSATFEPRMKEIAKNYMRKEESAHITNNAMAPTKKCDQEFINAKPSSKFAIIRKFLKDKLQTIDHYSNKLPKTLIFCKLRETCEKISLALGQEGISSLPISGLKAQDLREEAFRKFRDNEVLILVATDVCARGIDIKDIDLVMNFDMPDDYVTYVHRVGRCGRVRHGKSISYVNAHNDASLLNEIYSAMMKDGVAIPTSLQELISDEKKSTEESTPEEANNDVDGNDF